MTLDVGVGPYDPEFVAAIIASHAQLLGSPLAPPLLCVVDAAAWLYRDAPFAVLAHDTEADPRFVYANLYAQRCFEREWDALVGMPSRLSALPDARAERAAALERVARQGYAQDYRGLRVARSGRRFWIEQGCLWNVSNARGERIGQAALFRGTSPYEGPSS